MRRDGALYSLAAWLPLGLALAYAFVLILQYPTLVRTVYWNSDAASFAVAGQTAGRAGVFVIGHFASYATFAFLLLTRWAPFHRQLWEVSQYGFALAGFALLSWASWRLAGPWAAAMTATIGIAVSPIVNDARVALDYHMAPGVVAAVLACFVLWLAEGARGARVAPVAVLVTALAGASLVSDALFVVVGFVPFVVAGAVFLFVLRRRYAGVVVIACSILALPAAWVTERVARSHVVVAPAAPLQFAPIADLWPDFKRVLGSVVGVANGNFTQAAGWAQPTFTAGYILSVVCAALMVLALAAPFVLLRRGLRAPTPSPSITVWATFWGVCTVGNVAGALFTRAAELPEGVIYQFATLEAVAATVPVAMSTGRGRRSFAGIAIGVVLATSLINLLHWPKPFAPLPPLASLEGRISTIARQEGASRGYADYWDASALTWGSQMAVSVEPVVFCELGVLCPFPFDVVSTWYQPRDTGSFVLQDSTSIWMPFPAPTGLGRPEAVFRLDRRYTMYVYRYDVASRFDDAQTVWAPRLSYGGGFNWAEPFQGTTGRWMEQAGSVRIATGIAVRASVSAMAFSNQRSRTLELVNPSGVVLGKEQIPTYAVPVHFGPFEVPAGTSRFTLIATPGPQILGPTDPRLASIFLEPLTLAATPAIVPNA